MVQGNVVRWLPATVALLAALLLVSCQRSSRPAPTPPPPAPLAFPAVPGSQAAPGAATTGAPAPAPGAPSPAAPPGAQAAGFPPPGQGLPPAGQKSPPGGIVLQPQAAAQATRSLASAGSLLALGRDGRMLPEDFKIGPLGDALAAEKGQEPAMQAAGQFLSALVGGKVDKDLIADDARDTMAGTLAFGLSNGDTPTSWRLGRPRTRADGEVTAPVRLFGREGTSEGEIYVTHAGSRWLVADLQISLADLSVKSEKPKEKFFPLDYRWLLEE